MTRRYTKYKFSFSNESKLQNVWEVRMSLPRMIVLGIGVFLCVVCLAVGIIMLTPLKTLLPGYMKQSQRIDTIEAVMRLDSLQMAFNRNEAYLNNIINIYNTNRIPTDSVAFSEQAKEDVTDSLIGASTREQQFVRMIEEREKYNVSILAPLAAESMILTMPSEGGVITDNSMHSTIAKIIVPHGAGVNSITDGTVIDKHYDSANGGYTIMIQHNKGFISCYSGVGVPVVERGAKVITGQRIAGNPDINGKKDPYIYLQIWRNGVALIPADYIKDNNFPKAPIIDEDIGRGR